MVQPMYIAYVGDVTRMASRPGVQQTRMSRSITSSEPTPMKICDGLHPRRLAMAALSRTCRGSG